MSGRMARQLTYRRREMALVPGAVHGSVHLGRNGEHFFEVGIDGSLVTQLFGRQQVKELRALLDAFERRCIFDDAGPDRLFPRTEGLSP